MQIETRPALAALRLLELALVATLCACTDSHTSGAGSTALEPCRIAGFEREARCGRIEVDEDAAHPAGRRIPIAYAVIPALARNRQPDPVFVFAGGPGQGAIKAAPQVMPLFAILNKRRDIVFVDQRGTGASNGLECKPADRARLGDMVDSDAQAEALRGCWRALKADTRFYTTDIAMRDVDRVRATLGYDRINLWGGSYGTRAALEYIRQFPDRVRTATLDGVAPAAMVLPVSFAPDTDAAIDKLIAACEAQPECRSAYPGLRASIDDLLARLEHSPEQTRTVHPLTGETQAVRVTRGLVAGAMRGPLYSPVTASAVPFALAQAGRGDYGALIGLAASISSGVAENFSFGMHLSVLCAEDLPRVTAADVASARKSRMGTLFIDQYRKMCEDWPVGTPPPAYYAPLSSDVPVLILSGGLDPATPPRHGEAVAKSLPNALHLVAPNAGHGVSQLGCAPDLVSTFVKQGSVAGLDGACLARIPRPPFLRAIAPDAKEGA